MTSIAVRRSPRLAERRALAEAAEAERVAEAARAEAARAEAALVVVMPAEPASPLSVEDAVMHMRTLLALCAESRVAISRMQYATEMLDFTCRHEIFAIQRFARFRQCVLEKAIELQSEVCRYPPSRFTAALHRAIYTVKNHIQPVSQ
jgi:hypothetical protein